MCCVCLSDLGHKATCFVEPVFSVFLDNLMLEFFQKKKHLSVLRQVIGLVLRATCLVAVAYFGDFAGYEFLSGGSCEIAVVCRAV